MEELLNHYPDYAYIALFFTAAIPAYFLAFRSPIKNHLFRHFVFGFLIMMNILFGISLHPDGREMFELYAYFSEGVFILTSFYLLAIIILILLRVFSKGIYIHPAKLYLVLIGLPILALYIDADLFLLFSFPLIVALVILITKLLFILTRHFFPEPPPPPPPTISLAREGGILKITLREQWVDYFYFFRTEYQKLRYFLSGRIWSLTRYFPFSHFGTGKLGHYKNRQIMQVWDKILLVSGKLHHPLQPVQVGQVDAFLIYVCEIRTKRKAPWQDKFLKLLASELGNENVFIRPGVFMKDTLEIMVPRE